VARFPRRATKTWFGSGYYVLVRLRILRRGLHQRRWAAWRSHL